MSSSTTLASQRISSPSVVMLKLKNGQQAFSRRQAGYPGLDAIVSAQPETDAVGRPFPPEESLREQSLVLQQALRAGIGGIAMSHTIG